MLQLLDFSSIRAWTRHIAGASALIKLRGPKRFRTDFEKALLLGLCASLVCHFITWNANLRVILMRIMEQYTEAMIAGEACFLDDEEWKSVISSAVLEYTTFSYCSENIISLWLRTVSIARLFKEVQDAVRRPEHTTPQLLTELIERVVKTRTGLNEWKQSYDSLCRAITLEAPEREAIDQFDRRMEALGIYLTNMVILNRLACSLRPMTGPSLESETQQLASDIFSLEQRTATDNPRAYMFLAFKLIIAQAAIDTEKEWRRAYTSESSGRAKPYSMVPWPVFENFIRLKGREIEEIVEEADDKPAKDTELNWQGHSLPERLVAPL